MFGFKQIPKPVCGAEFDDLDGNAHTCRRAAPYWTPWHIHVGARVWFFRLALIDRIYYFPLRGRRARTR
jgi:hypothetical protein